jgi:hypothetical protein
MSLFPRDGERAGCKSKCRHEAFTKRRHPTPDGVGFILSDIYGLFNRKIAGFREEMADSCDTTSSSVTIGYQDKSLLLLHLL